MWIISESAQLQTNHTVKCLCWRISILGISKNVLYLTTMSFWSTYCLWWIKYITIQISAFKIVNLNVGPDTAGKCSCSLHSAMSGQSGYFLLIAQVYIEENPPNSWCYQQKIARKMSTVWTRKGINKVEKNITWEDWLFARYENGGAHKCPTEFLPLKGQNKWKNFTNGLRNIAVEYNWITIAWITLF